MTTWNELGSAKYLLFTTYRKDGTPVGVPIWGAPDGDRLLFWTNAKSWKVKRLKRNPDVVLQICNTNGKETSGDPVAGVGEVLDAAGTDAARSAVGRKYGFAARVMVRAHKLILGKDRSIGIAVTAK